MKVAALHSLEKPKWSTKRNDMQARGARQASEILKRKTGRHAYTKSGSLSQERGERGVLQHRFFWRRTVSRPKCRFRKENQKRSKSFSAGTPKGEERG